jgi:hypothetical protein
VRARVRTKKARRSAIPLKLQSIKNETRPDDPLCHRPARGFNSGPHHRSGERQSRFVTSSASRDVQIGRHSEGYPCVIKSTHPSGTPVVGRTPEIVEQGGAPPSISRGAAHGAIIPGFAA